MTSSLFQECRLTSNLCWKTFFKNVFPFSRFKRRDDGPFDNSAKSTRLRQCLIHGEMKHLLSDLASNEEPGESLILDRLTPHLKSSGDGQDLPQWALRFLCSWGHFKGGASAQSLAINGSLLLQCIFPPLRGRWYNKDHRGYACQSCQVPSSFRFNWAIGMAGSGNTSAFATDYGNRSTDECPWRDDYRARHADLIQQWKTNGIFSDGDLDDVNCYWLQFEPAPLLNHLILAFVIFVVSVIGCFSNALVVYILST